MKKRTWFFLLRILLIVAGLLVWWPLGHSDDATLAAGNKITVQLQWYPQAQFVGFYVAKAKNYYAEEGLAVEFAHGGPDVDPIKQVALGQAQIGLATGDQVLIWSDRNKDPHFVLKAIGTVFNQSIAVFMSKSSLGVREPKDLVGKTVGVYPNHDTENLLAAMLDKVAIPQSSVKLVRFPSFVDFENDKVQVLPAYTINEPLLAAERKIPVNLLNPSDFGVRFYSDTIITRADYFGQNQEILKKFLRASSKGWSYAKNSQDEALGLMYQVVRGSIGEGWSREHQSAMLAETVKYIGAGPNNLNFYMDKSRWDDMERDLRGIGRLSRTGLVDEVCDFRMVEDALR